MFVDFANKNCENCVRVKSEKVSSDLGSGFVEIGKKFTKPEDECKYSCLGRKLHDTFIFRLKI